MFNVELRSTNLILLVISYSKDWAKPPSSNHSLDGSAPQIPTPAQAAVLKCEESRLYRSSFPFKVQCCPDGSSLIQVQCTVAFCGLVFSSRTDFQSHLETHTAIIRTHPACPFEAKGSRCGKVMPESAESCVRHLMTHFPTIEQCSYCHKTFNRMSALENHIRHKHQDETVAIVMESA
jgi:hypothetical protein